MRVTSIIFTALLYLALVYGNNERTNEGASTSHQTDEIEDCARCRIRSLADDFVLLLLSEDLNGGDLIDMMNNRLPELEIFNYGLFSISSASQGDTSLSQADRDARLRYFYTTVEELTLELIEKACSGHFAYGYSYSYDADDHTLTVRENLRLQPGQCLCYTSSRERNLLRIVPRLPLPRRPEHDMSIVMTRGDLTIDEMTIYHVIPLPLISRFFRLWLADENLMGLYDNAYNRCANVLFRRLRRSMQKILLYSMKLSGLYSDPVEPGNSDDFTFSSDTVIIRNLQNAHSMLSGNMFVGPAERGPFDPAYGRSGEQLLEAFEYHIGPIIGIRRAELLLDLYSRLRSYVTQASTMTLIDRLFSGLHLYSLMSNTLHQHPITPFNADLWTQRRVPRPLGVSPTTPAPSIFNLNDNSYKAYWVIRPKRDPREAMYYDYKHDGKNHNISEVELKEKWRRFTVDALKISNYARSKNQTLDWSCNLTYLYSEYLDTPPGMPNFNSRCPECTSFDEYLYSKIGNKTGWKDCNFTPGRKSKWCAAWRRIVMDTRDADHDLEKDNKSFTALPSWKIISKSDVGEIVTWLMYPDRENEDEIESSFDFVPLFQKYPHGLNPPNSVDIALCQLTMIIPAIMGLGWGSCKKL